MDIITDRIKSRFGDVGVKATGGIAVFVLVLVWWLSPLAPVQTEEVEKKLGEIKGDTQEIVRLLEGEFRNQLGAKDSQIVFLQGQIELLQAQTPSPRAQELAGLIPNDADPYALALKAIVERRFDDTRTLLAKVQERQEAELSKIYEARGQTEHYAGKYAEAAGWYKKAMAMRPDDPDLMNQAAVALLDAGKYREAEPLLEQSLVIWQKALGADHPHVAIVLENYSALLKAMGKNSEATLKITQQ